MRKTAEEIYRELVDQDRIFELEGQIRFYLGDVNIVVKQKDVVGNIIQEWLEEWLKSKDIDYLPSENSQMPPDFFLNPDNTTEGLLEVKAFNYNASPGFDIADFRMFAEEIIDKPYMLYADYLIFAYEMTDDGYVIIKNLWLKKLWQISRRMENYPINLQTKDGVIHKIRPAVWYSNENTDFKVFDSLEDFISAFDETVFREPRFRDTIASTWLVRFNRRYRALYGYELDVPRWNEIKDKYDLRPLRQLENARNELARAEEQLSKAEARLRKRNEKLDIAITRTQKEKAEEALQKAYDNLIVRQRTAEAAREKVNALEQ